MSFDDEIGSFSREKAKIAATPIIVTETFNALQNLLDTDYLPKISKISFLKKYLKNVTEMNLYKRGWRAQFGSFKDAAGLCSSEQSSKKEIFISIQVTKHDENWEKAMQGVIFHEISHAVVSELFRGKPNELHKLDDQHKHTKGHGKIWKMICKKLYGHECRIEYEEFKAKKEFKNYKYTCTFCDNKGYGDRQGFTDVCSECGKSVLTEANAS